jgi:hypothetical protein
MGALAGAGGPLHVLGLAFLFTVVVVPTAYSALKAVLLAALLTAVAARELARGRLALDAAVRNRLLLFVSVGALLVLAGVVRGAPGALALASVYVIWPVVYCLLAAGVADARALHRVLTTLVLAAVAIELYALSYLLWAAGLLPDALYLPLDQGQEVGFYEGYVEFALYSITSLVFLVPFLVGLLVVTPRDERVPGGRPLVVLALVLGIVVVLLTGRRALWLVVAGSPLLALLVRRDLPGRRGAVSVRRLVLALAGLGGAGMLLLRAAAGVQPGRLLLALRDAFDFSDAESQSRGPQQFDALLQGWLEQPFFGAGLGAVAPRVIRSVEQPWAYELSYLALLFHVGVVGVAVYAYGAVWTLEQCRRVLREGGPLAAPLAAVLVGTGCFLLANSTNPYLQKFDSLWVLFLPIAVVNAWRLGRASAPLELESVRRS